MAARAPPSTLPRWWRVWASRVWGASEPPMASRYNALPYTRTFIHTCSHIYAHTYTRLYSRPAFAWVLTSILTPIIICTHTCAHTCTDIHSHLNSCLQSHAQAQCTCHLVVSCPGCSLPQDRPLGTRDNVRCPVGCLTTLVIVRCATTCPLTLNAIARHHCAEMCCKVLGLMHTA